jgi:hypothetical protein
MTPTGLVRHERIRNPRNEGDPRCENHHAMNALV